VVTVRATVRGTLGSTLRSFVRAGPPLALGRREVAQGRGGESHEVRHLVDRLRVDLLDEGDELADRTHGAGRGASSSAGALVLGFGA
jgi:hypothetical protein